MSMDRSLKSQASLTRHRNVLSRAERIAALTDQEKFSEGDSPFGLPKVAHRKAPIGGKAKKAAKTEEELKTEAAAGGEAKPKEPPARR
jgi:small basic protein (TIGR04137 family)